MGNHNSAAHPHEPLDRIQSQNVKEFKTKSSVRASFRRSVRGSALSPPRAGMDRLRRSFRESFRRRKTHDPPESARPHIWQADEQAVRAGTCTFPVKYLGCVEVFESRGMQVCEDALKILRNSRRRPVRAILHVSGDGLRVVEEETKGLIVDQTIEKVSFCAPDRNHERGFSYICRDGTTRRWMCHGFVAARDGGERLSHAVGCAFAACLERKQRRDKECAVSMSIDAANHAFTRQGSFRHTTMTEARSPPPAAKPHNPFAVERPRAAPQLLQRQGSLRALNNASPFKRQMSLRITDLPSHIERRSDDLSKLAQIPIHQDAQNKENNNSVDPVAAMCAALTSELKALAEEPVAAREPLPHPDAWLGRVAPQLSQDSSIITNSSLITNKQISEDNSLITINSPVAAIPAVKPPPVIHGPPRRAHSFAAPSPTPPTPLNTNPFLAH